MEAYKLSIVIVSDDADPSRLLEAIQEAGERIADECYGDCPEMDGANGMVQCLDETPTSNTITLGSSLMTRLSMAQRERDALLVALKRLVVLRLTDGGTAAQVHQSWGEAVAAIKNVEGGA